VQQLAKNPAGPFAYSLASNRLRKDIALFFFLENLKRLLGYEQTE
jgi:hypothetical protein